MGFSAVPPGNYRKELKIREMQVEKFLDSFLNAIFNIGPYLMPSPAEPTSSEARGQCRGGIYV